MAPLGIDVTPLFRQGTRSLRYRSAAGQSQGRQLWFGKGDSAPLQFNLQPGRTRAARVPNDHQRNGRFLVELRRLPDRNNGCPHSTAIRDTIMDKRLSIAVGTVAENSRRLYRLNSTQ